MLAKLKSKFIDRIKLILNTNNRLHITYDSSIKINGSRISGLTAIGNNSTVRDSQLWVTGGFGEDTTIMGAKIKGTFNAGEGCKFNKCDLAGNITVGRHTSLWGPNLDITSGNQKVSIGSFCSIARNVSMQAFNHNTKKLTTYYIGRNVFGEPLKNETVSKGDIVIKNDVWIGAHSVILGGVTINNGAIVAANSVVTKDVPPFSIVAGTPAKVISSRFNPKTIAMIEKLEWWNWPMEKIKQHRALFENELTPENVNSLFDSL